MHAYFLRRYVDHRDLHSFPTRRSSDLERLVVKARNQHGAAAIDLRAEERGAEQIGEEEQRVEALALALQNAVERFGVHAAGGPGELFVELERKSLRHPLLHLEKAANVAWT